MSLKFLFGDDVHVRIAVHVQPNAAKTEVAGIHGDKLKVRVHAPPVDGKANIALIKFFAATFGVPNSAVSVLSGQHGRGKLIEAKNISLSEASLLLERLLNVLQ